MSCADPIGALAQLRAAPRPKSRGGRMVRAALEAALARMARAAHSGRGAR